MWANGAKRPDGSSANCANVPFAPLRAKHRGNDIFARSVEIDADTMEHEPQRRTGPVQHPQVVSIFFRTRQNRAAADIGPQQ